MRNIDWPVGEVILPDGGAVTGNGDPVMSDSRV